MKPQTEKMTKVVSKESINKWIYLKKIETSCFWYRSNKVFLLIYGINVYNNNFSRNKDLSKLLLNLYYYYHIRYTAILKCIYGYFYSFYSCVYIDIDNVYTIYTFITIKNNKIVIYLIFNLQDIRRWSWVFFSSSS